MLYKVTCGKCNGIGNIRAYAAIAGGVCFTCEGAGFKMTKTKPGTVSARQVAKREEMERRIAEGNTKLAALVSKYEVDPRIPPRARQFEAVMHEAVRLLDRMDRGEIKTFELT